MFAQRTAQYQTGDVQPEVGPDGQPTGRYLIGAPVSSTPAGAASRAAAQQISDAVIELGGGRLAGMAAGRAARAIGRRVAPRMTERAARFGARLTESPAARFAERAGIHAPPGEYTE